MMKGTMIAVLVLLFLTALLIAADPVKDADPNCPSKLWASISIEVHGIWATILGNCGQDNPEGGCVWKKSWFWAHFQENGDWVEVYDEDPSTLMGARTADVLHAEYTSAKGRMKTKDVLQREGQPGVAHYADTMWLQADI